MSVEIKPKILMQICCVGCGVFVVDELKNDFNEIVLYFYNPNIWPSTEYDRRLEEAKKIAEKFQYEIIVAENNHNEWLGLVKGLEGEPRRASVAWFVIKIVWKQRLRKPKNWVLIILGQP